MAVVTIVTIRPPGRFPPDDREDRDNRASDRQDRRGRSPPDDRDDRDDRVSWAIPPCRYCMINKRKGRRTIVCSGVSSSSQRNWNCMIHEDK